MSVNPNLANREVCDLTLCDYKTQKPVLCADYANTTTTNVTGTSVFAFGGKGRPSRITFNGEKGGTLVVETQIQPFKLYSIMTGAAIDTTAKFLKKETVTTTSEEPTITLTSAPVGTVNVFAAGELDTTVPCSVSGTTVTLTTPAPGAYDVYYVENITTNVKKLSIKSTTFPKAFTIYAETLDKTEDDEILPYKMIYYKATPQPNFTITNANSGDPTSLTLTFDLQANSDDDVMDMILIEDDQSAI